ncbi:MAG TPA: alginate lyase family protein [Longimicrobiaceae bacterium]|nr:alginate lyase family protein [Longimicrobiaceae bacterium]
MKQTLDFANSMEAPDAVRPSSALSRPELVRLVAWKLRQRGRQSVESAGGFRLLDRAGRRWARGWRDAYPGGMGEWLRRPGAGVFWLPVDGAAEWARTTCTEHDLALADSTAQGLFELLGAGPVPLGTPPRWRRDLYTGREWPLDDAHRLAIVRGDGSDVRTVWELSRGYHFVALARAYWSTGEARYREAFVSHVLSWLEQNPIGLGPNWASPMDAAIRAANWSVAAVLFSGAPDVPAEFWEALLANLYSTGLFVERHLEWHPVYRGNHFVSNGVGLVYLGTLFRGASAGERWLGTGARIVGDELLRQVHEDGASFEASLAYHRLVTEFFACAGELLRANLPGSWSDAHEERLRAMYRFIAAYLPESGEAPMLGDADDGRLHALSARGLREPRRHALGLPEGRWPEAPASGAFPHGGFYVLRHGDHHAIVRCGAVGLEGAGSHDHNDQLSFELVVAGRRVVADSGTYAYTRDLDARFAFRGTAAHSVVQLGGEEQNPIRADRPWRVLADRTRSACTAWEVSPERLHFAGRHRGYAHRPSGAVVHRAVTADVRAGTWTIEDRVQGTGTEALAWRLHLAETVSRICVRDGACEVVLPGEPGVRVRVTVPPGAMARLVPSEASERYGERRSRSCILLHGEVNLPVSILTTVVAV